MESFKKEVGVPLQIGRICGDVGDGEEIAELVKQFGLMRGCVLMRDLEWSGLCRESGAETRLNEGQEERSPFQHGTNLHGAVCMRLSSSPEEVGCHAEADENHRSA